MSTFAVQVAQNPYLHKGADLVHAVLSVAARRSASSAPGSQRTLVVALLLDCSGSMDGEKLASAKEATAKALELLREDAWFCVIAGTESGRLLFPLQPATPANKAAALAELHEVKAYGGTAMSTWLGQALQEFRKKPGAIHHALLLTDGRNEAETRDRLLAMLRSCEHQFQCDVRGFGTDWRPDELRLIASKLLGSVDIIPRPADLEPAFRQIIEEALSKSLADVTLRLWIPQGARVEFCRQVYPETVEMIARGRLPAQNPQVRDYPTGSWGEEKRDYHLCIKVVPCKAGQRMCAGRVSLVVPAPGQEQTVGEAMILASWTEDEALSAAIRPEVAHYTGQMELANAIQEGLKARAAGDEERATLLLGRAVQLASQSNPETLRLLRKVVEVQDEQQGTVNLRRVVAKEDEFALDTRSGRTAHVDKGT
jgi:hypothetical protein